MRLLAAEVEGYSGEPYARIDGNGAVWVNTDSQAYQLNQERDGQLDLPPGVDSKGAPRWKPVSKAGRFEWHDHRMPWMAEHDPEVVKDKSVRTKVVDWKVPIRVDGRRAGPAGRGFGAMVIRALAAALALLALLPAAASAHATLEATTPARGARLERPPTEVRLHFNEPVEAAFGAVRVFDSHGREVQSGRPHHPGGRGSDVAVRLGSGVGDDGYTATYRVISADSHPIAGGFVFTVGDAAAPATAVGDLLDEEHAGPVTGTAFGAVRAVQFASIALALGALVFLVACWLPALGLVAGAAFEWRLASSAFARRLRALLLLAAAAGVLSAAAALVFQGAVAGGTSFWDALDTSVVGDVLDTRFGVFWGLAALAWLLAGALVLAGTSAVPVLRPASVGATGLALPGRARLTALAIPLAALAFLPALGGHASVQSPVAVLLPANVVHVVAMSAWVGGIAVLVLVLRAATARLDGADRTRLLAAVAGRFSALAGVAIAVLLASGVIQGVVEVRTVAHLFDTAFGRAVLAKSALFVAIVALGWVNRRRLLPALARAAREGADPGRGAILLRRTLLAELVLGLAALAVTGALAGYAPSVAESTGPYSTTADVGPARLEMTVDPARVGPNEIHLYLFDRGSGRQYRGAKEVTVHAELPDKGIAAMHLEPTRAGPGRYVISGAALGVAGNWTLEIAVRVSDFDEHTARVEVPIR